MSKSELEKIFGVYVDIDCLFDTRLSTLGLIDPSLILAALDEGYIKREQDSFSFLKKDRFKELYDLRDVETLRAAPVTNCFQLLHELVINIIKTSIDSPDCTGAKVYVNIYPYKLTNEEIGDLLELIVTYTDKKAQVEIIDLSPDKITVDFCDNNLVALVMYDYNTWLEANTLNGGFKRKSLNDLILMAPKLYLHKVPTDKEIKACGIKGLTPFKAVKMLASSLIRLEFMEVEAFSVDLTLYKQKHK